jgi:histidinol-phosphate phosphatase family protein
LTVDVVVPTLGRPSLAPLLAALAAGRGPRPRSVLLVDDRRDRRRPLHVTPPPGLQVRVLPGRAAGPAAARNVGWRASRAEWVAFLDDDVLPTHDWPERLAADLAHLPDVVAGSQGRVTVPRPSGRRPTDWEREVAGLERARWATADMAYRRAALAAAGGFDERFRRAYREDADLALRVLAAGWRIASGERQVVHPVPSASPWVSLRRQAGNADDALMLACHGRGWRRRAGAPAGRRPRHLAVTAAGAAALAALAAGRHRTAAIAAGAWLLGSVELAAARILPGPRTPRETAAMLVTSLAIPPLATAHWLRGVALHREVWLERLARGSSSRCPSTDPGAAPRTGGSALQGGIRGPQKPTPEVGCMGGEDPSAFPAGPPGRRPALRAVLFDRDGTLVEDVPYNGDPELVRPVPGARAALDRLRRRGVRIGVVSNQSGVARGLLTERQVRAVNSRVEELVGPIAAWAVCPHGPDDGCACRKPRAGLVLAAAARLGVPARSCAVVGDIGADVEAALSAGARAVLVPTPVTRPDEVARAPEVAADLDGAVTRLLGDER